MNPLKSISGTIVLGFVTAVIIALLIDAPGNAMWSLVVWLHGLFRDYMDRIIVLF